MGTLFVLSEDTRHLIYECLGLPDALSVLNVNGDWGTGRKFESFAITSARTDIDLVIEAIDTAADGGDARSLALTTRITEITVEWKKVSLSVTNLHPTESNQGVERKPAKIRTILRSRLQKIIPVFVEAVDGASGSMPLAG